MDVVDEARALTAWAVNDMDDRISVTALTAVREQQDTGPISEIFDAAGRSSAAFDGVTAGPVDFRRSAAVTTIADLLLTRPDASEVRDRLTYGSANKRPVLRNTEFDTTNMVKIEAGGGAPFPFYIDATPVTWGEYARFVEAVREQGPLWSHPGQQADHDHDVLRHVPADQLQRLLHHPVTHVSWFDAWAYAAWRGKKLPTTEQWEQAARVPKEARYPWGWAEPTEEHARFRNVDTVSTTEAYCSGELEKLLAPVGSHPAGATEAGVHDLLGNVWEWTRTRYLDGHEIAPFVGVSSYGERLSDWTLSACVKGGSWTTPADDLHNGVCVAKHVLQRGPETGFRCVVEPSGE